MNASTAPNLLGSCWRGRGRREAPSLSSRCASQLCDLAKVIADRSFSLIASLVSRTRERAIVRQERREDRAPDGDNMKLCCCMERCAPRQREGAKFGADTHASSVFSDALQRRKKCEIGVNCAEVRARAPSRTPQLRSTCAGGGGGGAKRRHCLPGGCLERASDGVC